MDSRVTICAICICSLFLVAQCRPNKFPVIVRSYCPEIKVMENLNVSALAGKWYEIARHPNPWEKGKCVQLNQTYHENGTMFMHWEQLIVFNNNNTILYDDAISRGVSKDEAARMSILFSKPPIPYDQPYWIIDTDYKNYYVAYACGKYFFSDVRLIHLNRLGLHVEFSWIMSRRRTMEDFRYNNLKRKLRKAGAFIRLIIPTLQENCEEDYRDNPPIVPDPTPHSYPQPKDKNQTID